MITHKHLIIVSAIVLVLTLTVVGIALATHKTVDVREKAGVGSYLVDKQGVTLYNFKNDPPGKSACAGPCVANWPVFYAETVGVPDKLDAQDFGTITRDDKKKQTTYKGKPLYYFGGDKGAGDTKGDGVKGLWSIVQP